MIMVTAMLLDDMPQYHNGGDRTTATVSPFSLPAGATTAFNAGRSRRNWTTFFGQYAGRPE
jgi:hypothetical protein